MIQARYRAYAVVTGISTGTSVDYVQVGDAVKMTEGLKEISANVLIEAMQDPVMVLDSRGLIAVQNAACRKLLGYALRDIVGKHLLDCVLASTYSLKELRSEKRNFNSAIKEDKSFVFEYQFAGKEGKSIHVLLSGSMLKDARKRTTHIIALLRDITESKRAERRAEHVSLVLQTIRNINQLIVRETDQVRLIQEVCDILTEGRGFFNAWIVLLDESNELLASAESGLGKEFLLIIEQLERGELTTCAKRSLIQSEVVVTEDPLSTCTDCPLAKTHASRGGLTIRLENQGKVYGLMSSSVPTEFIMDEEEHSLYKEVAGDIGFALHKLEVETQRQGMEDELKESKSLLDEVTLNVPGLIFQYEVDTKGKERFNFISDGIRDLMGIEPEAVLADPKAIWDVYLEEYIPELVKKIEKSTEELIPWHAEYRLRVAGTDIIKWVEGLNIPKRLPSGHTVWNGWVRDITERKEAEEQLRVSEEKHKRLFETSQDGIVYTDVNGSFFDFNQGFLNIVGYDREELLSKTFLDITPEKWASIEAEIYKTQIRTRGYSEEYEKEFICKDGIVVPVSIRVWLVQDDEDRPLHTIAVVRDITKRKRAEEKLEKHRNNLEELVRERTIDVDNLQRYTRELIEVNLDSLITFNQEGVILDVNGAMVRATGRARDELIGTTFAEYFTDLEKAHNAVIMVFKIGEVRDYELIMKAQNGAEIVVVCNASVYKDQAGQITGAFLAARDITERKRLEIKLLQKDRLAVLGQLSAGVGHELRNPLGVIKNAVFFLRMVFEQPEPEIRETLEILENEVATSDRIISNLLDYARSKPPTPSKIDINEVVQTALSSVALTGNITVVTQLDKALPTIHADPNQLGQVFMNLALNAIQAMPAGGQLTIKSESEGPDWLSVSIADTGVGISKENMEKLFEPLFTTKAKGIGLGLAIVKTIVDGHGATIEVESAPGKGAVFKVRLPIVSRGLD